MSLERKDFAAFFAAIYGDAAVPFAWQERLLDSVLESGTWPSRIVAPTGAGKTAAIDVHVFATALTGDGDGPRPPRRLAMVVPRRVLVDDQHSHARDLARLLARPGRDVLGLVAERLDLLRWPAGRTGDHTDATTSPLMVGRLRGGAVPSRGWRDHPTACAVLCATPDMFGSRLLFRGYGATRQAWPREAGLLAFDTVVVVDEAHLSRQLVTTVRRVARLAQVADEPLPLAPIQVVETTATPVGADDAMRLPDVASSVGVADEDRNDAVLGPRLTRPKPVRTLAVTEWPPTPGQRRKVAVAMADAVVEMVQVPAPESSVAHTIGCYVNTVPMAVAVADELRGRRRDGDGALLRVVMVCGQARPADVDRLDSDYQGVLSVTGNRDVDVIVSTQSLEVGVDLDLAGVVTELAAGSALAQRVGRVNRRGQRDSAPVRVVVGTSDITDRTTSGPYRDDDLRLALKWLTSLTELADGMAPWSLREHPPPQATMRRMLLQRPEAADVWHWARTSDDLAARPELDLWLADSLDDDTTVGVLVRDVLPTDATDAVRLLRLLPPRDREIFSVPYRSAQAALNDVELDRTASGSRGDATPPMIRVRGEDTSVLRARKRDGGDYWFDLRPGDLVVLDSTVKAFTPSRSSSDSGFSPPVLTSKVDVGAPVAANDVSQILSDPKPGQVVLRLEAGVLGGRYDLTLTNLLKAFADEFGEAPEGQRRRGLATLLTGLLAVADNDWAPVIRAAISLLGKPIKHSDVHIHYRDDGTPLRLLVIDRRRVSGDELIRQTWTPSNTPVTLDQHQGAVAGRATLLGERLRVPQPLLGVLAVAGAHHDDGKEDPRFQDRLGASQDGPVLAKSDPSLTVAQTRVKAEKSDVPDRWRHEQLSVVRSWDLVHASLPPGHAHLALRLVGTSHGHGRGGFPHTANELLRLDDLPELRQRAEDLFDLGGWDELVEHTHRRWGVWGCAYLEALLRAADGQVSSEGS